MKIANVNDIPEGKSLVVEGKDGEEIALFKVEGQIYALNNACPHMGGPLAEGDIEDCTVTCPWHGWQFDLKTGACLNMPGEQTQCPGVKVSGKDVLIEG